MNARDALYQLAVCGDDRTANQRIDAYRAEVRREVLGDDANPSVLVLDAQAYRRLADDIAATMDDPDRWDGDEPEDMILGRYVKWLADGKPPLDDEWDGDQAGKDTGAAPQAPAGESTQPALDVNRVVAYRSQGGRILRCLAHAPSDLTGFVPVTSEDLPDGGICTLPDCGRDVLILGAVGGEPA